MKIANVGPIAAAALFLVAAGCDGDVTDPTGAGGSGATSSTSTGDGGSTSSSSGGGEGGQGGACTTDADCATGVSWCVGGACVPCDNSGLACDILCIEGWTTYERNGCFPCACAPINDCTTDLACAAPDDSPGQCYTGNFCWDWCPPGDPTCCFGNVCSPPGCSDPAPTGCLTTGCPEGQQCVNDGSTCASSACSCDGAGWLCTPDCGGGACVPL